MSSSPFRHEFRSKKAGPAPGSGVSAAFRCFWSKLRAGNQQPSGPAGVRKELSLLFVFRDLGLMSGVRYGPYKGVGDPRRFRLTRQNRFELCVLAIDGDRGVVVFLHHRAFQGETGKHALGARISEHFSVQFPVGARGGMTANRARRNRAFTGELEFAAE